MSIALSRGPAYHLMPKEANTKNENQMPVRGDGHSKRINEDVRSVTPERHYDKSQRSAKSQEKANQGSHHSKQSHGSHHSQAKDASPQRDGQAREGFQKNSQASDRQNSQQGDNKSQRSGSVRSTDSVSVQYRKVSSSLVSNPDNLICDDCINKKIGEGHKDKALAQKEADKEHALRTNANLKRQLEEEKEKHLEKLRLYKEGIDGQNQDLLAKRAKQRDDEDNEKQRIKKQLADNSDLIEKQKRAQAVIDKYRDDLGDQLDKNREAQFLKEQEKLDLEKKAHNLLIDDGWRGPHRKMLVNHYKENLLNQLDDNAKDKSDKKKAELDADADYMNNVIVFNNKDKAAREAIEAEKRALLKNELDKQLLENADKRQGENDLKKDIDDKYKQKIDHDNQVYLDNLDRKNKLVQGYLQDLTGQARDKELEKQQNKIDSKKHQGTGLHIPGKVNKCYNCAVCRRIVALERLNKRYEIARSRSKAKRLQKTQ